jgi:hypothetical protein
MAIHYILCSWLMTLATFCFLSITLHVNCKVIFRHSRINQQMPNNCSFSFRVRRVFPLCLGASKPNILSSVLRTSKLTVYLHLIYHAFSVKTSVFSLCLLTPRTSITLHKLHLMPLTLIFSHF